MNAPLRAFEGRRFRVTHPFHPLHGQEFDLVESKTCWGGPRVYFCDRDGRLRSLPTAWTSMEPADPFVETADGRSAFRLDDLLHLVELLKGIGASV